MNPNSIIIQQASKRPDQLILLFHGVGATPDSLLPLGHRLAAEFSQATVVSIAAPYASDVSLGYQWFSVLGVSENNRTARVAAAMPAFLSEVCAWQRSEDATAATTVLIGFSQGAIMALESTSTVPLPAAQVVAIAGRFAKLPVHAASHTKLHLLHGKLDAVIPYRHAIDTAHYLYELGDDVSADVLLNVGHEIDVAMMDLTVERLKGRDPQRNANLSGLLVKLEPLPTLATSIEP